jgi:hypothetical protein
MSIEAMKQALDALEEINKLSIGESAICLPAEIDAAIDALRQAIEQAKQQEPVAWLDAEFSEAYTVDELSDPSGTGFLPLYTAPPKKHWVGLTDEEVAHIADSEWEEAFVRLIEAKLKEKNT